MREICEIIKAYDAAVGAGKKSAIASVVHLNGSSYRRPGARMLVTDDGNFTGAISGGCLEGDALRKAMLVLSQQQPRLVTYDTNDEDDASIGMQLGCEGIIQVLFEPINENDSFNPVELLRKAIVLRQKSVLITLFSLEDSRGEQAGTCLLLEEDKGIYGTMPYTELHTELMNAAHKALQQKESFFKNYTARNNTVTAFIEYLRPPVSVVIIGAGNDAIPLMQMADIIGWDVRVVDGRSTHAKAERFVNACQVLVSRPEEVLKQIEIDEYTFFVLMTHNYNYDKAMLKELLMRGVRYIGVLGPRKKLEKILNELHQNGVDLNEKQLRSIHGPVGLEIGAETPEEIALSIIAEIKAVLSGKSGKPLREKEDAIHSGTGRL